MAHDELDCLTLTKMSYGLMRVCMYMAVLACSISCRIAYRFGPLKEPEAKEFASMIFLGDTRGEGITMPLEMATVGELSVFAQGAGVVAGDKAKSRYMSWDRVFCLGSPFCMIPLTKKGNNEWLGCLSMVFKSPFGGVAVPAWRMIPNAQMVSSAFDEGQSLATEQDHISKDKEMLQRYFLDAGVQMKTTFPMPDPEIDMLYPLFMRGLTVAETADYSTVKVHPCCTSWFCLGLEKFRDMNQACPRGCGAAMQSSWSIKFTMVLEDVAGRELDAILEGHYCRERLLGFIRKDRGSYALAPNEEEVYLATGPWKNRKIWIVRWWRPHTDKATAIHVVRFGVSDGFDDCGGAPIWGDDGDGDAFRADGSGSSGVAPQPVAKDTPGAQGAEGAHGQDDAGPKGGKGGHAGRKPTSAPTGGTLKASGTGGDTAPKRSGAQ